MFALDGSKVADVGDDGSLFISCLGAVLYRVRKTLPDLGGNVSSGCSGGPGTNIVFFSVDSKVHRVDYQTRQITRTWDLPGPVLQLASGPRGIVFALVDERVFSLDEDECAVVRDHVQGIFSCPVLGRLYVSC